MTRYFDNLNRKEPIKKIQGLLFGLLFFCIGLVLVNNYLGQNMGAYIALVIVIIISVFTLILMAMPIGWKGLTQERLLNQDWRNK